MMIIHIYGGLFIAEPDSRSRLATWDGAILCLDRAQCPDGALNLGIAGQPDLEPTELRRATRFIHEQRQQGKKVVIYTAGDVGQSIAVSAAYLVEYYGMALEDAYMLTANRFYVYSPPRGWTMTIIEEYGLPYTMKHVYDNFFYSQLMSSSNLNIHHIDRGVHLSSIDAMRKPERVKALGITAVLRVDDSDRVIGGHWPTHEFTVLDMPLYDGVTLAKEDVRRGAAFIHQQVEAGNKVLVHCHAGVSRSVTMVLAYLIEYGGLTLPAAFNLVVRKRPVAYPHAALVQSLVLHYQLPYRPDEVLYAGFLDNLLAEFDYLNDRT